MRFSDLLRLSLDSALRARMRSIMLLLAMSIGVAAVIALTSLGEGARNYVAGEFQALGTRLVIVIPGRTETGGVAPGMLAGETPRDLTLADAEATANACSFTTPTRNACMPRRCKRDCAIGNTSKLPAA